MSLMLFFDRLLLSRYSVSALDAAAMAGTLAFAFLILPITISAISEVFVGRYNGEGRHHALGWPVWQMGWFALMLIPICLLVGWALPPLAFEESNYAQKAVYFKYIMAIGPLFIATTAVAGFFIGTGRVRVITVTAIISNCINIILDSLLINGWGALPALGIRGAAIATAIAEFSHLFILVSLFLSHDNRKGKGTGDWHFEKGIFTEAIRVGFPSGLGLSLEITVHYAFFYLMERVGQHQLTIAALTQSFFLLLIFTYEGLSKGVTAICSNLLGSNSERTLLLRVIHSALLIHTIFALILTTTVYFCYDDIVTLFLNQREEGQLLMPTLITQIQWAFGWLCIFYLFDGYARVFIGMLTAAGDTAFILYTNVTANIAFYLVPLVISTIYFGRGTATAWMIIAFYGCTITTIFRYRYYSERWMISSERLKLNSA